MSWVNRACGKQGEMAIARKGEHREMRGSAGAEIKQKGRPLEPDAGNAAEGNASRAFPARLFF